MTRQKPTRDEIHSEILRDLERNPPARKREDEKARPTKSRPRKATELTPRSPLRIERPTLMLRRLRQDAALRRLDSFVRLQAAAGTPEILVIVGKGKGSPEGESVLGPAVLAWCEERALIRSVRRAPAHEGGEGALILSLRAPAPERRKGG